MKKLVALVLLGLTLLCSVASAEIKTYVVNEHRGQIDRTSLQEVQVLPDTKAQILFSSLNITNSGSKVPNFHLSITLHANHDYVASPTIKYLSKKPLLDYTINGITKTAVFDAFASSSPAGSTFQKSGKQVTPNGDGSYTVDKAYDRLDKPTPADLSFSFPDNVVYDKSLDIYTRNPELGQDFISAINTNSDITLIITHYPTKVDAIDNNNKQKAQITIPATTLREWKQVMQSNGF